jgi:hypothetical protein
MRKKPKTIDFEGETRDEIEAIKSRIGQEVPLSRRYTQGARALLARPQRFGFPMELRSAKYLFGTSWTIVGIGGPNDSDGKSFVS